MTLFDQLQTSLSIHIDYIWYTQYNPLWFAGKKPQNCHICCRLLSGSSKFSFQ